MWSSHAGERNIAGICLNFDGRQTNHSKGYSWFFFIFYFAFNEDLVIFTVFQQFLYDRRTAPYYNLYWYPHNVTKLTSMKIN